MPEYKIKKFTNIPGAVIEDEKGNQICQCNNVEDAELIFDALNYHQEIFGI